MSSADTPAAEDYSVVPCGAIVFRVASKKAHFDMDARTIRSGAFIRYRGHDDDGLSLFMGEIDSCEKAAKQLNKPKAVGSLHVGSIRDMGTGSASRLDVIQDEPIHGLIVGLPFHDDDVALAEFMATKLADHVRVCWPI